jgi:hypothetical protein
MGTFNMKNFKLARVFAKDIEIIIKQLDDTTIKLAPYGKYRAVGRVLKEIKDNKAILQSHYTSCKQIVASKGEVKENK